MAEPDADDKMKTLKKSLANKPMMMKMSPLANAINNKMMGKKKMPMMAK